MEDMLEKYQELFAHKYLLNEWRIQKRALLNSLRDKICQSYQEKITSGQPSSLFLQKLVQKSKISNQTKAQNEQNPQKKIQLSKSQDSYLNDKENIKKAECISLLNNNSFQNDSKEYLRERIVCQQQCIQILELLMEQKPQKQQQDLGNNCKLYSIIKEISKIQILQLKGKYLNNNINKANYQTNISLTQIQRQNLLNLIYKNQINQFNRKLIHIVENQLSFSQFSRLKIEKSINNGRNKLLEEKTYHTLNANNNLTNKKHFYFPFRNEFNRESNKVSNKFIVQSSENKLSQAQQQNLVQTHFNQMKVDSHEKRTSNKTCIQQQINRYAEIQQNVSFYNCDNKQLKVLQELKLQTYIQYFKFKYNNQLKCQDMHSYAQKNKILGGGVCCSKQRVIVVDPASYQLIKKQIKHKSTKNQNQDDKMKEEKRINKKFEKFNKSYNEFFTIKEDSDVEESLNVLETEVRQIIEKTLYDFREQIVLQEIRPKVIDMINLLINYFLIIKQNDSKSSVQSDINEISEKLQKLIVYCKENKERHPCLDLFQYFDILKSLNSQRVGLDQANKHVAMQIIEKIVEVAKFGAGFVSIAGAIQNLTEIDFNKLKGFINDIRNIVEKLTFDVSVGSINQGLGVYSNYNSNNISNNMLSLWLKKVQYMGENLSDQILEIIFYLEECDKIQNNDTRLFVYMQLNYLLSKQQIKDNYKELRLRLEEQNKIELIISQQMFLQVEEYSDGIIDLLKSVANLIAQSHQFRYIKAQLLLHFAQILSVQHQNEFNDMMNNIISNYLMEKQKSVKIVSEYNQVMAEFIDNQLDQTQVLNQISKQKKQITKHLDKISDFDNFAYDIQNEKDLDKQLAKYFVQIWEQSVKQRQKNLEITHKDDALLQAIHLYVNQQITYQDGYKFNTQEKDAVKQIFDYFLIPNFVFSQEEVKANDQANQISKCKIISILAEGGSGKSMLLKKIEVEVLNDNSKYKSDNRTDFIPFIIKCNSLDKEKPSIEDYLESLSTKRKDIDNLKKSERNKLIMLDGYDEYTGDYFKVYEKLNLNEWVNTLVVVTSRLEKISISDAKVYFNYYDNQGKKGHSDSYGIFKLEKITNQDIEDYLEKYQDQQLLENQEDFDLEQHEKLKKIIFSNYQLTELLKLPINLYLTTRMISDIDLNDEKTLNTFQQASDQIVIQELFFSQQFKKQAQIFVEQQKYLTLNDKQRKDIAEIVESCYFEYFQSVAMHMFIQKGQKSNFLSTTREQIKFQPREEVSLFLQQNKIDEDEIIKKLINYVDSRVITRIQLKLEGKNTKMQNKESQTQMDQYKAEENESQEFEFRHKSLFEYFAARAMKYDFDLHKENIFKLDISQLQQFNINKRIIMSSEKNVSEQQILLKLYKLMQSDIQSQFFYQTYSLEDISKTNKYIQYLNKSKISKKTEKSQIDIGASNLLSALFLSKFSYPNLILNKCSFSLAYIQERLAEFQDCNLSDSLIENANIKKYKSSNTKNAMFGGFQKLMDSDNIYQFNKAILSKNNLVSITESGFINKFEIGENNFKQLLSKQITNKSLKNIYYESTKSIFVTHTKKSLFEINSKTFEIISSFTFASHISCLSINKQQYFVNLNNNQIFQGDFQKGFTLLDQNKIQAESSISLKLKDIIITSKNKEIIIYNQQNLQIIKNIQNFPSDLAISSISSDEKYLAAISEEKNCIIFNLENEFDILKTIQTEHTKPITSVAFSENGKYLATSSDDNSCKIWNVKEGFALLKTFDLRFIRIHSVTFSTDGRYLIICYGNRTCKILDSEQEFKLVNKIEGHTQQISSVAFSPNDQYIATGSDDKTCKIWSIKNGLELVNKIEGHTSPVTQVAFSGDSKYLATASKDQTCKIWNIEKGFSLHHTLEGNNSAILSVTFSADSKYLATASFNSLCIIWDVDKGFQLLHSINAHDQKKIFSVAFSFDGKLIATGSEDTTCKVWNIEDGIKLIKTIQASQGWVQSVAFSPNGKYLAAGCSNSHFYIWNVEKGYELLDNKKHECKVNAVVFSANSQYLATSSANEKCMIWNVEEGLQLISIIHQPEDIYSVAFSQDSKQLVTGGRNTFMIWNLEKGFEFIKMDEKHNFYNTKVAFSSDGKLLATTDYNFYKIWSAERGFELINKIEAHTFGITQLAFSQDGNYLVTISVDICKVWSIEKGFKLIHQIQGQNYFLSIAISPDSMFLAISTTQDYSLKIWNIQKNFQLITTINDVSQLSFSPDGRYLAASYKNTFKIFDAKKKYKLLRTIQAHISNVQKITFSNDGQYLATCGSGATCKIWSIKQKFELEITIEGDNLEFTNLTFSADSKYLATASNDKTCKIWNAEHEFSLISTFKSDQSIKSIEFSSDNKYLALSSFEGICRILNIQKEFEIMNLNQLQICEIKSTTVSQVNSQLNNSILEKLAKNNKIFQQIYCF
ncbi:WD domain, G-beta repeat protein (macronuclear) [Tetrahymena thermophila SB210]|uniref:WD domain, G-beta repeat protein n=1 Tax=Tetrahymena thermophila (strain SB210) TaxID=312017 RepID=Q229E9_TETTS|nr:WD domain, G-beta repeat protein [Tetrahymena thermophila SB210]EAR81914.2 WD domain, G-beta repeat protein [Tetrahymena thermophila SB210]|eukprot:XP_001029577.2 WD domain, G-beta repeat protein [Tetrahymena thermophila SB210]